MHSEKLFEGVWPVMLTPFDQRGEVDFHSLERLINWYIDAGVHGLFALCQSSEIFALSDREKLLIGKFVLDIADGRVPVVVSGHTAESVAEQREQMLRMEELGAAALIFISNRFATPFQSDDIWLDNLRQVTSDLKRETKLGFYECPAPYKRLLTPKILSWCLEDGRYRAIKDTCCNIDTIRQRLVQTEGSELRLLNANTATLLSSLQAGAAGYSGVMANFHPALYVWLYENYRKHPEAALKLSQALTAASMAEHLHYPVCAKHWQTTLGNFATTVTRVRPAEPFVRDQAQCATIEQMQAMIETFAEQCLQP